MTNNSDKYYNPEDHEGLGAELTKICKENSFKVPENYFDELPQKIQEKVSREKHWFSTTNLFVYLTNPFRLIALGSVGAAILLGLFLVFNHSQQEIQFSDDISFEDVLLEYPDMIEYMDDQVLMDFAAAQMTQQDIDLIGFEYGFDSILFQNGELENLTDEEITEIIYNL